MRHRVYGKHLGRNKDERDNLFKGLAQALFTHGTIQTSEARAKAIKGLIDKIINLAKDKKQKNRFQSILTDKDLRERLISEIIPKLGTKTSGFTSIVRTGTRLGDQTTMVRMSLIGAEELKPIESRVKEQGIMDKRQEASKKDTQPKKTKKKVSVEKKPSKKTTKAAVAKRGGKKS